MPKVSGRLMAALVSSMALSGCVSDFVQSDDDAKRASSPPGASVNATLHLEGQWIFAHTVVRNAGPVDSGGAIALPGDVPGRNLTIPDGVTRMTAEAVWSATSPFGVEMTLHQYGTPDWYVLAMSRMIEDGGRLEGEMWAPAAGEWFLGVWPVEGSFGARGAWNVTVRFEFE